MNVCNWARAAALLVGVVLLALPVVGCGVDPTSGPSASPLATAGTAGARPTSTAAPTRSASTSTGASSPTTTSAATEPAAAPINPPILPKPKPSPLPQNPSYLPAAPRGSRGVVYLTFDDGPSTYTHAVLHILTRTGSTATFFQLGDNQQVYPKLPAAVQAQGSTIGNHSYDHNDLTTLSDAAIRSELRRGPQGAHCARPPYGATTPRVRRVINSMGMTQMLWSNDTSDWSRPGSDVIFLRAAGPQIGNGSVVLMHDGGGPRGQTVAVLPRIIAELQRRGYLIRKLPGC